MPSFKKVNGHKLIVGDGPTELYRHFDNKDRLLYVGISWDAFDRYGHGHRKKARWAKESVRMTIERFASRAKAEEAERIAIREEKPIHNKAHALTLSEQQQTNLPIELPVQTDPAAPEFVPQKKKVSLDEFITDNWQVMKPLELQEMGENACWEKDASLVLIRLGCKLRTFRIPK